MKCLVHLTVKVSDDTQPLALQVAQALTHYAALLVGEAMGGPVISSQSKLEFGRVQLAIDIERGKDYEPPES